MQPIALCIPVALAVWTAYDANRLGARRGRLGGGLLDRGPVAWFFFVAVTGIIGICCYKSVRARLLAANSNDGGYGFSVPAPRPAVTLTHEQQRPGEKIIYPAQN